MSLASRVDRVSRRIASVTPLPEPVAEFVVPNPVEFAVSEAYLGQPLAPRQATLLKIIFLRDDLFTSYDLEVIDEWMAGFTLPDPGDQRIVDDVVRYHGEEGVAPDLFERMRRCKAEGRQRFGSVVFVGGRRCGKGHVGGVSGAYIAYGLLATGNPQQFYGIAETKQLRALVFAGTGAQAVANQFADLTEMIHEAPCFDRLIDPHTDSAGRLGLFTPAQLEDNELRTPRLLLQAKQTTSLGGRGPACFMLYFDEFAHNQGAGSTSTSEELWQAALPSLAQCGTDAFIYQGSSPWAQDGQFFINYQRGLQVDERAGGPVHHDSLVIQLTSWGSYLDAERGPEIEMWPGGPHFPAARPVVTYDAELRRREEADPDGFNVEYRARWRTSQDAYLRRGQIALMFGPHDGIQLTHQVQGRLNRVYLAHGDPSKSGANFGFAVAHAEEIDGRRCVVFDLLHAWRPTDFPDHQIDYIEVEVEICRVMDRFHLTQLTFDQFSSAPLMAHLRQHADRRGRPVRTMISERTATQDRNTKIAEAFKTALGMGLLRAPPHALARQELEYLQEVNGRVRAPETGPVRTKDVADAMMNVVFELLGDKDTIINGLRRIPHGSQPGGIPMSTTVQSEPDPFAEFRRSRAARRFMGGAQPTRHRGRFGPGR